MKLSIRTLTMVIVTLIFCNTYVYGRSRKTLTKQIIALIKKIVSKKATPQQSEKPGFLTFDEHGEPVINRTEQPKNYIDLIEGKDFVVVDDSKRDCAKKCDEASKI